MASRTAESNVEGKQRHPFVATPCQPEIKAQTFAVVPLIPLLVFTCRISPPRAARAAGSFSLLNEIVDLASPHPIRECRSIAIHGAA